jgi:hypothetical protein
MTAGMTTQTLEGSRVSLPRAGLGALLAATLLAGGLIGAAVYAGIGIATAQPAAISVTVPHESTVVRNQRIHAGRGQLVGDMKATTSTAGTTYRPTERDGFGIGVSNSAGTESVPGTNAQLTHAPRSGPLP